MAPSRPAVGRALAVLAAVGYLATAWIHSTGFDSVTALANEGPSDLAAVAPALWLGFSLDLVVLALVIGVVAFRPGPYGRAILAIVSLTPFGAAGLQLRFLGFIPPTAILLGNGTLAVVASLVMPSAGSATGGN